MVPNSSSGVSRYGSAAHNLTTLSHHNLLHQGSTILHTLHRFVPIPRANSLHEGSREEDALICNKLCCTQHSANLSTSFDPGHINQESTVVAECTAGGDAAFANGRNSDAISEYTKALKAARGKGIEAELLSKRSAVFSSLAMYLRRLPAQVSESNALYGMDPWSLAKLALKDGQRVSSLFPKNWMGHLRVGFAYYLLESYYDAKDACLSGLSLDPHEALLHDCLRMVNYQLQDSTPRTNAENSRLVKAKRDIHDLECTVCLKLLFDPITTPCGHSFCRSCLVRSLDHNNKCPFCRTVLHLAHELPGSVTLRNILMKMFPDEYEERRVEVSGETARTGESLSLPLFVMGTVMPGEKTALNIFEPRYRLMVRRVMEGSRRFAMAQPSPNGSIESVAVECEIVECEALPDGRFFLELIGRNRINILELSELDGYRVGKVEILRDSNNEADKDSEVSLGTEVASLVEDCLGVLRFSASVPSAHDRMNALLGRMGTQPSGIDTEALSFWAASMLPSGSPDRMKLLKMISTKDRLSWLRDNMTN